MNKLHISSILAGKDVTFSNYTRQRQNESIIKLITSVFLYGLLIVISAIGITNIYNAIMESMNLRKNEFKILNDIGMTKKQTKKMLKYEGLIYSLKALVIGIILGIGISYYIYTYFEKRFSMDYYFPIYEIILAVVVVFTVIFAIIRHNGKVEVRS